MNVDSEPEILNVRETARRLGVHENTIRNWVQAGILPTARVPGTRFHRFYAEDVERLRHERGASTQSIDDGRRTIGPELVNAAQLAHWPVAMNRDAQDQFPELIRQLLEATPGVSNISVRAGDGVATGGWDGHATVASTAFLPTGELWFEMGVGANPRAKADEDWKKRLAKAEGAKPAESIFAFATPRRFLKKSKWVAERREEGKFADVVVVDCDDLEGWLKATPSVHIWISEHLGRRPRDVETLAQWWDRFKSKTDPALPGGLFQAGREPERAKLREFLSGGPDVLVVESLTREDVLAFVATALEVSPNEDTARPDPSGPALVVTSSLAWDQIVEQSGTSAALLPMFDSPDVQTAQRRGHHVVLPVGRDQAVGGQRLKLPRPGLLAAATALSSAGVDRDRAHTLAALARRNLPSLLRELARDARFNRPGWSTTADAFILAPLILVGAWTPQEGDTQLVSQIVGEPYPTLERVLIQWQQTDDPPFIKTGEQWHVASSEEAFLVLGPSLTRPAIERWLDAAVSTLTETDPRLTLTPDERPLAGIRGISRKHSGTIRQGIADGVALLGAAEGQALDGGTGAGLARVAVERILRVANDDVTGAVWHSLSDVLPRLAEGAPDAFLDAVHDDLDQAEPILRSMFQDRDQSALFGSSSPHTGLLWALETLAWSPEYLPLATRALARLQAIDPGGRLSNRPIESLKSILIPWIRQTSATLATKISAVEAICDEFPDVGWKLVQALWPSPHGIVTPPSGPRHRDWSPETRTVSISEWLEYIEKLVDLAIALAGKSSDRWAELSEHLSPLPPPARERMLAALEVLVKHGAFSTDARLVIWERIRHEVGRHRQFSDADWSMAPEALKRMDAIADDLAPQRSAERFAYLFDWHPNIEGVDRRDFAAHEARVRELRAQAVAETLKLEGIEGLQTLAARSPVPRHLGLTVGEIASADITPQLLAWLDDADERLRDVATGWATQNLFVDHDSSWLRATLNHPGASTHERKLALALSARGTAEVWDLLLELDPELHDDYWTEGRHWRMPYADVPRAIRELCRYGRAWAAVDVIAGLFHAPEPERDEARGALTPNLVGDVLQAALVADPRETKSQTIGYELGLVLDYMDEQGLDQAELAKYEFVFFNLLDDIRAPRALFSALGNDASLFVDLVSRVYRGKNEPERKLDQHEEALAQHAWWVIRHWDRLPGRRDDDSVDGDHLRAWVQEARLAFTESDRADIGDTVIGEALAASPPGSDGIWPAEPVRDLIEDIGSPQLESGIQIGARNARGFTSRGVFDGGQQEWALAGKYRDWATRVGPKWRRTSRILRGLAEGYEQDARREDDEAARRSDTEYL
jgi:excisionase family DNA binding protein